MTDERWMDVSDLAVYMGWSEGSIRKLAEQKVIPGYPFKPKPNGKKTYWKFKKSEIDNMPPMM